MLLHLNVFLLSLHYPWFSFPLSGVADMYSELSLAILSKPDMLHVSAPKEHLGPLRQQT